MHVFIPVGVLIDKSSIKISKMNFRPNKPMSRLTQQIVDNIYDAYVNRLCSKDISQKRIMEMFKKLKKKPSIVLEFSPETAFKLFHLLRIAAKTLDIIEAVPIHNCIIHIHQFIVGKQKNDVDWYTIAGKLDIICALSAKEKAEYLESQTNSKKIEIAELYELFADLFHQNNKNRIFSFELYSKGYLKAINHYFAQTTINKQSLQSIKKIAEILSKNNADLPQSFFNIMQ